MKIDSDIVAIIGKISGVFTFFSEREYPLKV